MFTPWSTFFSDEGRRYLRRSIELALDEDGPDLTAQGLFAADAPMHAVIRAKEDTHVVGLPVIHEWAPTRTGRCWWRRPPPSRP